MALDLNYVDLLCSRVRTALARSMCSAPGYLAALEWAASNTAVGHPWALSFLRLERRPALLLLILTCYFQLPHITSKINRKKILLIFKKKLVVEVFHISVLYSPANEML